jgi:PAS domain S-box-containing protein
MRQAEKIAGNTAKMTGQTTLTDQSEPETARAINQRIFDTSLDLILVVDRQGNLLRVSPSSLTILGYRPDEMIGRSAIDFVYPEDLESTRGEMRMARRGRSMRNFDTRYVHRDGRAVTLAWTGVWSEEEKQHFFIGRDMTERMALEQQLRQAQKMEAIGQLTGGVAHDFNNILTVITGMTEMLGQAVAGTPQLRSLVKAIEEAAEHGAQLTQRMLAFARKQPLQARVIDLNSIVTGMSRILHRVLGDDVTLVTTLADGLWEALADPSQVEDAILNLAINSRDAMPDGGRIALQTANVHLDAAYAAQNIEVIPGDYAALIVTDNGTGMSPHVMDSAFEPFFTTKDVGHGTGLGLSTIYGFAKQSRGHVKIYSEVGYGTTIKLYLPRAAPAELSAEVPAAKRDQNLAGRETILVVEDNVAVRRVAVRVLEGLGYRVRQAADGNEALTMLRQGEPIDLLFTDIVMPNGVSGLDVFAEARQLYRDLRVLFTSGYSERFVDERPADSEGTSFLPKPYGREKLAAAIRNALGGPDDRGPTTKDRA